YRSLGTRVANLDPIKRHEKPVIPELDPSFYGLTEADMDEVYSASNTYFTQGDTMTLRDMVGALKDTYCRSIGAEFMHMSDHVAKSWIHQRLASTRGSPTYTAENQLRIMQFHTE